MHNVDKKTAVKNSFVRKVTVALRTPKFETLPRADVPIGVRHLSLRWRKAWTMLVI
jgi:hypothetical protein